MGKRSNEKLTFNEVAIFDIAEEGKGVGRVDDLVLFVKQAVPGDVVNVEVTRKKKNLAEAKVTSIISPSQNRESAFCQHFGVCGGCKWQHMTYQAQLHFKQKSVESALSRIGKIDVSTIEPILPSAETVYYRNKLEYTFSNQRWLTEEEVARNVQYNRNALGFHVPLRFDKILAIEHCYLQASSSNEIRNRIYSFAIENDISFYDLRRHEGALRNLIIRNTSTGELMIIVVFAYPNNNDVELLMSFLHRSFPEITSLLYIINQKRNDTIFDQDLHVYAGRDHLFEKMGELTFKIGAKSFYQTNSKQAFELYKLVEDFAGLTGKEVVYDLYTGAGTIANFIAGKARKVIGIEYVPTAVADAKVNAGLNKIDNATFYAGDMKDILKADFIAVHGKPNVIITDPPRAGMHAKVVENILEMAAEKIVYVSCNAATQARDLARLTQRYIVKRIKPVDMFPHTQHVENIVLLQLR